MSIRKSENWPPGKSGKHLNTSEGLKYVSFIDIICVLECGKMTETSSKNQRVCGKEAYWVGEGE